MIIPIDYLLMHCKNKDFKKDTILLQVKLLYVNMKKNRLNLLIFMRQHRLDEICIIVRLYQ